ncbi:serine--tRNA ligase [Culicoidibacter larvae]|uniref:Serine--tRNA ligase n=1 Tax=Culicoidibacter larvae TaxID=2579976 RepID=A0A5R8QHH3_9FIRM|nr:serine--tRNA ligase [Culicoidibacter larvae]TLG77186.1 serine--tRNA ligase [Culicoidibacter larvae]
MIDMKIMRENLELVKENLVKRQMDSSIVNEFPELDSERKVLLQDNEALKNKRNEASKLIGTYKREGKDTTEIFAQVDGLGDTIKANDERLANIENKITAIMEQLPNILAPDVPVGKDEDENIEIRKHGVPTEFNYEPKAHWDIIKDLDIIDLETAAKLTGTRFAVYKDRGAKLARAIMNFMLDTNTKNGYTEMATPHIVNRESLYASGQLPKFAEDLFKLDYEKEYYLIPTAEVPLVNTQRDNIINQEALPIKYTAYTQCYRSEAGAAGRDTRGLIRQHQFEKVELVAFTTPDVSAELLEILTGNAEQILQLLGLPYRVIELCSGDTGFGSAKTYDIEVWLPSYNAYKEISSCSNMGDFQARRANIKYRNQETGKLNYVHTLNGSSLAIGRTIAAILENYQNEDGSVNIPEVLVPYFGETIIK